MIWHARKFGVFFFGVAAKFCVVAARRYAHETVYMMADDGVGRTDSNELCTRNG